MWANIARFLVVNVLLPLIKDGIFMLVNFFKVRQLREEKEKKDAEAIKNFKDNPSSDTFSKLP